MSVRLSVQLVRRHRFKFCYSRCHAVVTPSVTTVPEFASDERVPMGLSDKRDHDKRTRTEDRCTTGWRISAICHGYCSLIDKHRLFDRVLRLFSSRNRLTAGTLLARAYVCSGELPRAPRSERGTDKPNFVSNLLSHDFSFVAHLAIFSIRLGEILVPLSPNGTHHLDDDNWSVICSMSIILRNHDTRQCRRGSRSVQSDR